MISKPHLTKEEALQKIKQYCAYQERSHSEVKEKLYSHGLNKNDAGEIVSILIVENFLNEERFAINYAGGKFRIKQWGRVKIKYGLRQKQVSEYCIKNALAGIDDKDYLKMLGKLAANKLISLKREKYIFIKKKKLQDYLKTKGYETGLVNDLVNDLVK